MADAGEGPGGPGSPYFQTKQRPEGPNKILLETAPENVTMCIQPFVDLTGKVSRRKSVDNLIQKCDIPYFHLTFD